jgi:hypothetical protein
VLLYQCLETAEYIELETENQISPVDAWHYSERTYFDQGRKPINEFKVSDTIKVLPLHFSNIQLLWKPDMANTGENGLAEYKYPNTANIEKKVGEIKELISKTLPDEFPMSRLDEEYGMLSHPKDECIYNIFGHDM